MWGQVVVALRDDDTIRRRRADAEDKPTIFLSIDGGRPPSLFRSVDGDPARLRAVQISMLACSC